MIDDHGFKDEEVKEYPAINRAMQILRDRLHLSVDQSISRISECNPNSSFESSFLENIKNESDTNINSKPLPLSKPNQNKQSEDIYSTKSNICAKCVKLMGSQSRKLNNMIDKI